MPLAPLLRLLTAQYFLPDANFLPSGKNLLLVSSIASLLLHTCHGRSSEGEVTNLFSTGLILNPPVCVLPRAGITSRGNQLIILSPGEGKEHYTAPCSDGRTWSQP